LSVITALYCFGGAAIAQQPTIRVLVKDSSRLRFRADGDQPLLVDGIGSSRRRVSSLKVFLQGGQHKYSINGNMGIRKKLSKSQRIRIKSRDSRGIWLGKRRYRGELRIYTSENGFNVVNHLPIEKYLMSVVGSEMPKSWPIQALKAQAVAARTYALQQLGRKEYYDVSATEASQVYLGIESETQTTKKAVKNTHSLVLVYKGNLINAVFHSSSGGRTEYSGSVWRKQLPYLVSVKDFDQHSPHYRWELEFSPDKLSKYFPEIGILESIKILNSSETNRILKVEIKGPKGVSLLSGKELRKRLGLKSTLASFELKPVKVSQDNSELIYESDNAWSLDDPFKRSKSYKFDSFSAKVYPPPVPFQLLEPLPILQAPSKPLQYVLKIIGSGAGHGVGMSQWGANGLAKKGASFKDILTHYYRGAKIVPY